MGNWYSEGVGLPVRYVLFGERMADSKQTDMRAPAFDSDIKLVFAVLCAIAAALVFLAVQPHPTFASHFLALPDAPAKALDHTARTAWEDAPSFSLEAGPVSHLADADEVTIQDLRLTADEPRALPAIYASKIEEALAAIEENGECSFVFLDAQTGKAISYHAGLELYLASSSKAPLAYYALAVAPDELPAATLASIRSSIVASDNDSFFSYGYRLFDHDYIEWLKGYGINHELASGDIFLSASARSLCAVWADILLYVEHESQGAAKLEAQYRTGASIPEPSAKSAEPKAPASSSSSTAPAQDLAKAAALEQAPDDADWLGTLFANTNVSFIREGIDRDDVLVLNKAGWIASDPKSTSDAGIVHAEGRPYLMAIISSQPDCEQARKNMAELARILFEERALIGQP